MKGLRVAHETLGPEGDPNSPNNRPKFLDPLEAAAQAAADAEAAAAAAMGMMEGGGEFDGQTGKFARDRRGSKQPRDADGRSDGEWGADGERLLTPTSTGLKVRCCVCACLDTSCRSKEFGVWDRKSVGGSVGRACARSAVPPWIDDVFYVLCFLCALSLLWASMRRFRFFFYGV